MNFAPTDLPRTDECYLLWFFHRVWDPALLLALKEIAIRVKHRLFLQVQQWILLALADLITEPKKALPDVRLTAM